MDIYDPIDNDRYITCNLGHTHWGAGGAAGLMLHHQDGHGIHRYLMQQRAPWVQHGGTWAPPSGALAQDEHPVNGAMREAFEELGQFPSSNHQVAHVNDHGGWRFHTVTADTPAMFDPELDDESADAAWLTPEEIDELPLHPGFLESWNELRPPAQRRFTARATPDAIHVSFHIPEEISAKIHRWAKKQDWPEGTELEDPDEYHITVLYSPAGRAEHKDASWIHKHLGKKAQARITGLENFDETDDGSIAHVLRIDSADAKRIAEEIQANAEEHGMEIRHFEGGYKAHLTLGYGKEKADLDPPKLSFETAALKLSEPRIKESVWHFGVAGEIVGEEDVPDQDEPGNDPIIDHLTLSSVAHNLHYRYEKGPLTSQEAQEYAARLLDMIGYRNPDPMMISTAINAWQTLYPTDRQLSNGPEIKGELQAPATEPTDSWGYGTTSSIVTQRPLYHWTDASNLHEWMDPSHTGPGETYLTEHGDVPDDESWNPDVPMMRQPVRIQIDHDALDPEGWDNDYRGWLNNYLYRGAIPPEAVVGIKAFPPPDTWDMPEHWSKTAAVDIPAEPGQTPIPEGTLRFFHYTTPETLDSIRKHGLLYERGRGDSGTGIDEPSKGVWASTIPPKPEVFQMRPVIEYWAYPDQISYNAEHPWGADPQEWGRGYHHVIMNGDVPPNQFAAIHEPWHSHYRYLIDAYPTAERAAEQETGPDSFDWALDPQKGGDEGLARGVQAWKNTLWPHLSNIKPVVRLPENEGQSTEPSEVNDPEDHWPEWGGQNNDQKTHEIQYSDSSTATI